MICLKSYSLQKNLKKKYYLDNVKLRSSLGTPNKLSVDISRDNQETEKIKLYEILKLEIQR